MKTGIRARLLLLTLAPATLTAAVLATYLTTTRIQDFEKSLGERSQTIANQLAFACADGVASGNKEVLNALAQSAFQEADVKAVLIQDASGNSLVSLGKDNSAAPAVPASPLLPVEALVHRNSLETHSSPPSPAVIGRVSLAISRDRLLIHRQETIQTSALLGFCCLLLVGILGQRISHSVSVPPLWMDEAIKEPRDSHYDMPTQEPSASGWHEVESDIEGRANIPKTAHKQLQEKIDEATAELRETMEELEIKNVELDIARKKALQASRVKSEFLANMSHEIRTPMNGVMGFIELLSKTKLTRTQHGYLKTLWASAENLMVIINDVLDFSKIEAGKFKIRQRNFDLREAVENAVLLFAANAHYKGIKLILDIEPEVPSNLMGDASRIAQIVTNFVSNAVKFTDRGEVEVLVRKVSESAQTITFKLSVRDTGIGIALADQKRLFNAFQQLDTSTTRRHSGTGLGLTICQRLVTMMNGRLEMKSRPGKGSVFEVTLKLAKQESANLTSERREYPKDSVLLIVGDTLLARAVTHILEFGGIQPHLVPNFTLAVAYLSGTAAETHKLRSIIIDESSMTSAAEPLLTQISNYMIANCGNLILLGINEEHPKIPYLRRLFPTLYFVNKPPTSREVLSLLDTKPRPPDQSEEADHGDQANGLASRSLARARVLLTDDNLINRQLARIFLDQLGHQVDEAANGMEAINACQGACYDLILMDIHMPDLDGLEVTRRIRALLDNPNKITPIIALTADVMNQERANYLQAGMNDYLSKPITKAALRKMLDKWCSADKLQPAPRPLLNEDTA